MYDTQKKADQCCEAIDKLFSEVKTSLYRIASDIDLIRSLYYDEDGTDILRKKFEDYETRLEALESELAVRRACGPVEAI